ncbi:carbohydrate kinase [bacterium]|nr:carbohydrate kinase [candidate division CSSED10-310 bacterium]
MEICDNSPLIFGEVLFDIFPNGSRVLGGAPFNVAWHLQGFGLEPRVITRIGNDKLGDEILQRMYSWNMNTDLIQRDTKYPTGTVQVKTSGSKTSFRIKPDAAYDYIEPVELPENVTVRTKLLYHGSLACRNSQSFSSLLNLKKTLPVQVFLDINLRDPWWNNVLIHSLIANATWVKMNRDELHSINAKSGNSSDLKSAETVRARHGLDHLIVTMGEEGAFLVEKSSRSYQTPSKPVSQLIDTVGAGDGFAAVCILGLLREWQPEIILRRAATFAARICMQRGAISKDSSLYRTIMTEWRTSDEA